MLSVAVSLNDTDTTKVVLPIFRLKYVVVEPAAVAVVSLVIQSLLKNIVGVTPRMAYKVTPLTIRNFRYGFRKSFFEKQKNIFTDTCSPWYNGVERVIFPKNEISRHGR